MTDSMQQMALDTLGAYFGYTSFRPGQDRMVDAILAGRDALGVMPTGAGKSICYQVPALMLPGITFVVSPLLSLMEDQTRALLAAGARPSYLNSSLTPAQQNTVLKRAREGRYQLMYVAPERLLEPRFLAFAQEAAADGGIGVPLVAIDEAHCVSQWGQDFRPAYLQIREFIDSLPQRPIVAAFTATATERVRADIQQMLGLQNPATVVTGFDRKNLYFGCEEMGDKAKTAWVRDYVIAHSSESGIVYCSTRKTVDALAGELAEALGPSGIRVGRYHAGMGNDARRQSQRAFIDDDIQVMVATNAFGMGIDKPNVRYVIHNNVPESIEAYYQEAGRAGRDGDPASCHLLWNGNDFRMRRFLIDRGDAADEALDDEQRAWALQNRYRLLSQMEGYCNTTGCLREYMLRYFGDEAAAEHAAAAGAGSTATDDAEGCGNCSNCLTKFEVEDVTDMARAAVRYVATRPMRFGKSLVADVLHGGNTERIRRCIWTRTAATVSCRANRSGASRISSASCAAAVIWPPRRGSTRSWGWARVPARSRTRRSPLPLSVARPSARPRPAPAVRWICCARRPSWISARAWATMPSCSSACAPCARKSRPSSRWRRICLLRQGPARPVPPAPADARRAYPGQRHRREKGRRLWRAVYGGD